MSTRGDPTVIGVFVLGALTMLVHFAAPTHARRVLYAKVRRRPDAAALGK